MKLKYATNELLYEMETDTLGLSNFLKEISSLSHPIVLYYFFALIAEEGFLMSLCYSLELCIQMPISFLFSFAFHLSSFIGNLILKEENKPTL